MSSDITVEDVMTPVKLCIKPEDTVVETIATIVRLEVQSACVCNEAGKLIGIFTEKEGLKAYTNSVYFDEGSGTVDTSMTADVISVEPEALVTKVALLFVEHDFNQLPVVKDEQVIGEIRRGTLLKALTKHQSGKEETSEKKQTQTVGSFENKQQASPEGSAMPHGFDSIVPPEKKD